MYETEDLVRGENKLKTYYWQGWWEDPWECGDGCCSGGGEYHINFSHLEVDGEEVEWHSWFGTEWEMSGPYFAVYQEEYEEKVPVFVHEMSEDKAVRWIKQELAQKDVCVVVEIDE